MSEAPINKEAALHRLHNQRRIAFALIERLHPLLTPGVAFNHELRELFRSQGRFGSSDRRLYRELVFAYLRYQPWLDPLRKDRERFLDAVLTLAAPTKEVVALYRTMASGAAVSQSQDARFRLFGKTPEALAELLPEWFAGHASRPITVTTLAHLISRPPLWLRLQSQDWRGPLTELQEAEPGAIKASRYHPTIPGCIEAPADLSVAELACYQKGAVEIQDVSSQVLLQLLPDAPRGRWLDACAGAGGKTLQLSSMLEPHGKVFAHDPRQSALTELAARVERAGYRNVSILPQRPTSGDYDGVLVDAPCSGSGTWRRHPYLMRQTREQDVLRQAERQKSLLAQYSELVRPRGLLVYCTCSLSRYENEEVGEAFLAAHPAFQRAPLAERFGQRDRGQGITIFPEDYNGDGLHIAAFLRQS